MKLHAILTFAFFLIFMNSYSQDDLDWNDEHELYAAAKEIFNSGTSDLGQLNEAKVLMIRALAINPNSCKYKYCLGLVNYKLENLLDAEALFLGIISDQNESCQNLDAKGMLRKTYGKLLLAKSDDNRSVEIQRGFDLKSDGFIKDYDEHELRKIDYDTNYFDSLDNFIEYEYPWLYKQRFNNVIIFDKDENRLNKHKINISKFMSFLEHKFSFNNFSMPLTIILSDDTYELINMAENFNPSGRYPIEQPYFGIFFPQDNLLMATSYVGYGTVYHELMHVYLSHNIPYGPHWFTEAFATLYERANWQYNELVPIPNWRMDFILYNPAISLMELSELLDTDDFYSYKQQEILAYLRLLLIFLESEGLLNGFYNNALLSSYPMSLLDVLPENNLFQLDEKWKTFIISSTEYYKMELELNKDYISYSDALFIQKALNHLMSAQLTEDGVWGPKTEAALKNFQLVNNLDTSGTYNKETRKLLNTDYDQVVIKF